MENMTGPGAEQGGSRARGAVYTWGMFPASTPLLLLLPVLLIAAIAVRIDSSGPALFRQQRVGRDGADFWMVKLRRTPRATRTVATPPSTAAPSILEPVGNRAGIADEAIR